jgi:N-acetylneuraminic acid mutarotase
MPIMSRRSALLGAGAALVGTSPAMAMRQCLPLRVDEWQTRTPLPVNIQEIYPAVLDGRIYVAGGLQASSGENVDGISDALHVTRTAEEATARQLQTSGIAAVHCDFEWQARASLPEPRHHPNLVGHAHAVYAIGGFHAVEGGIWGMLATNTRYDPEADSWTEMTPLPQPFAETCAVSLNGMIHVATGRQPAGEANAQWTDHTDSGAHFVYDAGADSWHTAAPNPNPRNSAAGVVLNGRFHVVAGRTVGGGNQAHHEAYDPQTDSWQSLAPMPQGQGGLAAAVSGGKIYAFGGEWFDNGGGVYPNCWVYDPHADSWSAGPDMLSPRHGLGGVSIGDTIYAIGGALQASGRQTSGLVEMLTPAS